MTNQTKRPAVGRLRLVLVAAFAPSLFAEDVEFSTFRTAYTDGHPTRGLALADLDEDGLPDLITVNSQEGGPAVTTVLCVDGDSYDTPRHWIMHSGRHHRDVAAGDVNGDGHADVVAVNEESDDAWLFLGRGDGTLSTPGQRVVVGDAPWAVAVADLDGDSRADVLVANFLADTIAFVRGFDGGLLGVQTYRVGDGPQGVTTGDFNEDGHLDVAVSHLTSLDVRILLGDRASRLTPAGSFPVHGAARDIASADLDGDGHLDLVTANDYSDDAAILFGDGSGGFSPAVTIPVGTGSDSVACVDWDRDGHVDVALTGSCKVVALLPNRGGRSFGDPIILRGGVCATRCIEAGDLDGDGHVDLAIASDTDRSIFLLKNDGSGRIPLPRSHDVGYLIGNANAVDLNRDGHLDVLLSERGAGSGEPISLAALLGLGRGRFSPPVFSPTSGSRCRDVAVADLDGDGFPDAVVSHVFGDDFAVMIGDGLGGFTRVQRIQSPADAGDLYLFDYDGDEVIDLISISDESFFFPGLGNGLFGAPQPFSLGGSLELADFNEDGLVDIAAVSRPRTVTISFGLAPGAYAAPVTIDVGTSPDGPSRIYARDWNGDGHIDVATLLFHYVSFHPRTTLSVALGDGSGIFAPPVFSPGSPEPYFTCVADFNEDGLPDLVAFGTRTASIEIAQCVGDGTFDRPRGFYCIDGPSELETADVDEDGHVDLLLATHRGLTGGLTVLSNRSFRHACRAGNADGASGRAAPVLSVDGSTGVSNRRLVRVRSGDPARIDVARPPAGGSGLYAVWALDGEPTVADETPVSIRFGRIAGIGIACRCLPVMNALSPGACACPRTFPRGWSSANLSADMLRTICVRGGLAPAPASNEIRFPVGTFTLTGLIADPNSPNEIPISLTNSVVVVSRPD